jgi:hypothetical protein
VSDYCLGDWGSDNRRGSDFSSSTSPVRLEVHPTAGYRGALSARKPEREADNSPPSTEIKYAWLYFLLVMAWPLLKHRDVTFHKETF